MKRVRKITYPVVRIHEKWVHPYEIRVTFKKARVTK